MSRGVNRPVSPKKIPDKWKKADDSGHVTSTPREANRDGYITEDPSEFVDTVRKSSDDNRRPFTIAEIQRVPAAADPEWRSLVLFGLYTGQRLADIAALTWDNLDLSKNEIRLRTRKTGKRIMVPICEAAEATC